MQRTGVGSIDFFAIGVLQFAYDLGDTKTIEFIIGEATSAAMQHR
jgi:hypothetical protein